MPGAKSVAPGISFSTVVMNTRSDSFRMGVMVAVNFKRSLVAITAVSLFAVVAACAPKPAPAPVAPPKPQVEPRPYPPMGAAPNLPIPLKGADGTRITINSNLSPEQAAWTLRSALNVAALNCMAPQYGTMIEDYRYFLNTHKKSLADVNSSLDKQFKTQHGKTYIKVRETYQTQVYNYFALPPTMPAFCDAALAVGQEFKQVPAGDLVQNAPPALARLESVFLGFYEGYDKYRVDFVDWQKDYNVKFGVLPSAAFFLPGELRWQPDAVAQVNSTPVQLPDYSQQAGQPRSTTPQVWGEVVEDIGSSSRQ